MFCLYLGEMDSPSSVDAEFIAAEKSLSSGQSLDPGAIAKQLGVKATAKWVLEDPRSVVNLLPESVRERVLALPPTLAKLSLEELENLASVSRVDRRVRIEFWREHERAAQANMPMNMDACVRLSGLLSWSQYEFRLEKPERLAWLLCPPAEYQVQLQEALEIGLNRLVEIVQLPLYTQKGEVNTGVAAVVLQALKMVDQRLHGSVVQRMLTISKHQRETTVTNNTAISSENIDAKIAELEAKIKEKELEAAGLSRTLPIPDVSDAEVVEE